VKGQFSIRNSTLGKQEGKYTVMLYHSTGIIENSTIEGSSWLRIGSILDCKQVSISGTDDIFVTEDETVTLQIFNSSVFGEKLIKSGPGTSIRANIFALSDARDFEGGENIKIDAI
jgi:hypothetical protein